MNIRFRPRRLDEPEYVTVWDGARAAREAGATPVAPPPAPERGELSRADVLAALRAHADGLTMREIADALETTLLRVNSLLYQLVKAGQVVSDDTALRKRWGGTLRRYRVVAPPTLDVRRACGAHTRADVSTRPRERSTATRP